MKRLFSTVLFLCYKCGLYPGLEHVRGPGPHRPGEGLQVEVAVEDGDWCGQGVAAAQQPLLVLVVDPLQILQGEALLLLPQILVTIPTPFPLPSNIRVPISYFALLCLHAKLILHASACGKHPHTRLFCSIKFN